MCGLYLFAVGGDTNLGMKAEIAREADQARAGIRQFVEIWFPGVDWLQPSRCRLNTASRDPAAVWHSSHLRRMDPETDT